MTQSDLSKAERRNDPKLSTLRALVEGRGLQLELVAVDPDTSDAHELLIP
jgi:hypothetical protein